MHSERFVRISRASGTGPTEDPPSRVALVNNITGERWALGDVGKGAENFTIPCYAFQVEGLTKRYLSKLVLHNDTGMYQLARDGEGRTIQSQAPVSCVLSKSNKPVIFGNLAGHANEKHEVKVMFGQQTVCEEFEDKEPNTDLLDVQTPSSQTSSSESDSKLWSQ